MGCDYRVGCQRFRCPRRIIRGGRKDRDVAMETSGCGEFEVMPRAEGKAVVFIIPVDTVRQDDTGLGVQEVEDEKPRCGNDGL